MEPSNLIFMFVLIAFSATQATAQSGGDTRNLRQTSTVAPSNPDKIHETQIPRAKTGWLVDHSVRTRRLAVSTANDGPAPAWVRHYINPTDPSSSAFASTVVDKKGNIYAGGYSEEGFPRNQVALLAKYDNRGMKKWVVEVRIGYSDEVYTTLAVDSLDNIYAFAPRNHIAKFSPEGVKLWSIDSVEALLMAVDRGGNVYAAHVDPITGNSSQTEVVTTKYNSEGVFQWTSRHSALPASFNYCLDMSTDASANVILSGVTWSDSHSTAAFVVKYHDDGTKAWGTTYPGIYGSHLATDDSSNVYVSGSYDQYHLTMTYRADGGLRWASAATGYSRGIAPDGSGNVVVAINTSSTQWNIVKYDHLGATKWIRSIALPSTNSDVPLSLAVDMKSNSFVAGSYDSAGHSLMTIVSLDSSGFTRYLTSFPECTMVQYSDVPARRIALSPDSSGNVSIVGGADGPINHFEKALLVSLDRRGSQQWLATYEGPKVPMDASADMGLDSAGNIYVCGTRPGSWNSVGSSVLKYSPIGDLRWKCQIDSASTNGLEHSPDMRVTRDGSVFVLHGTNSDTSRALSVTALSSSGELLWSHRCADPGTTWWRTQDALFTNQEENIYVVACTKAPPGPGYDGITVVDAHAKNGVSLWSSRIPARTPISAVAHSGGDLSILTIASDWYGTGEYRPALYRLGPAGNVRWIFQIDSVRFSSSGWMGIVEGESGSVRLAGTWPEYAPNQKSHFRAMKLNAMGICEWTRDYDEGGILGEEPSGIVGNDIGDLILTGTKTIVSYDALGNQRWVSKVPVDTWGLTAMTMDKSGNTFIGFGLFRLAKYSTSGVLLWSASYSNPDWSGSNAAADLSTAALLQKPVSILVPARGFHGSEVALATDGNGSLYVAGSFGDFWSGLDGPGTTLSSVITLLRYDNSMTQIHDAGESKPAGFNLSQNYPNPFNPSTTIRYGLPHKTAVQLSVFNTLGQQVAQLVNGEQEAGYHEVKLDGTKLASGVYLYRITAGSYVETRKLLLVR